MSAELRNTQRPWPSAAVRAAVKAMGQADSVTIDPHKLGYIPYPAGAVLFRDKRVRDVISVSPAYLEEPLIGSYIVEGSKPGAAAAACWLASATLPLSSTGHGILMRRAIANAYSLADGLRELSDRLAGEGAVLKVINYPPDLNIVCFVFNFPRGQADSLSFMNAYMEEVYRQFLSFDRAKALSAHSVIVSKTEFKGGEYDRALVAGLLRELRVDPAYFCERGAPEWRVESDDRVFVLRCVVMNPWLGMKVTHSREIGPARVRVEELTFVWRFIDKLTKYIRFVKGGQATLDGKVRADRELEAAGIRVERKGPRLERALIEEEFD